MNQDRLEDRVRELFEEQGFKLEKTGNRFKAKKESLELLLSVYSSQEFSAEEVVEDVQPQDNVFVDEGLEKLREEIENEVSIIREQENEEYPTPSYEVIGTVAVINDLGSFERQNAVEGILHHQPNVETVLLKEEGLSGEFRVGDYEKLYGEETETEHKEFGCLFKVDPTKVYYSERFSTERKNVVDQIQDGEKVLIMFAGVGPFAIMAAKHANPEKVVAVEKNPVGADYLKQNIELNKVENIVEGIEGDVAEVVPNLGKFDRIIMPLPEAANKYLDLAFEHLKEDGVIHYYRFLEDENWSEIESEIQDAAEKTGSGYEIVNRRNAGDRAAYIERVCVEIKKK